MNAKTTIIFSLGLLILISLFFINYDLALAINAPQVIFSGDDYLQNGGTDDDYDSLVILDITSADSPEEWSLQYSTDSGDEWEYIITKYQAVASNHRIYYWSTSNVPSLLPVLLKINTKHSDEEWSDFFEATLNLSHRRNNVSINYLVEDFDDDYYKSGSTDANWDEAEALVELAAAPAYPETRIAVSTDMLSDSTNKAVIGVSFQPVQWVTTAVTDIEFQLSNNSTDWYGDLSGSPSANWFSFDEVVPDLIDVPFEAEADDTGLYWKARFSTDDDNFTPQLFQLRFIYEENNVPQACFVVNPSGSLNPDETYVFNANCSSDYQDSSADMDYRWDFGNGDIIDWDDGERITTKIYNSTSSFEITLGVRDSHGETDSFINSINLPGVAGSLFGWLWSSNYGWTSLNCDNIYFGEEHDYCSASSNYGWKLNSNYTMDGWAWDSNLGWLCLGASCSIYGFVPEEGGEDPNTLPYAYYSLLEESTAAEVLGWAKYLSFGENGWVKLNWQTLGATACDAQIGENPNYCVMLDLRDRSLEGWGWAGGNEGGVDKRVGPGWVRFAGLVNASWLETQYSSIYSQSDVGSLGSNPPPEPRFSATYCILAGGDEITNFISEKDCLDLEHEDLGFPQAGYRSKLGTFDLEEIEGGYETILSSVTNIDEVLPFVLGNKVYIFANEEENDFYISEPITFYNAQNLDSSGAGTVIVKGNLHIGQNVYYDESAVTSKIENLSSVAWIVYGDVIVNKGVTDLVGAFIILGDEEVSCSPDEIIEDCGRFVSGNDEGSPKQLVVNGLIVARQFEFQRTYKQQNEPAEAIIYDSRVLINIPPGLDEVSRGLPVWREAFATTELEE